MWSCTPQQSNISTCGENDVGHVSTIFSSAFGKHIMYTHICARLFFLLPYPCNLSHIVRKKSTLTQQPIIVFQETQNEIRERERENKKRDPLISEDQPLTNNITQIRSHCWKMRTRSHLTFDIWNILQYLNLLLYILLGFNVLLHPLNIDAMPISFCTSAVSLCNSIAVACFFGFAHCVSVAGSPHILVIHSSLCVRTNTSCMIHLVKQIQWSAQPPGKA